MSSGRIRLAKSDLFQFATEEIRDLLLASGDEPMAIETELLLMFASRAQHIQALIRPRLSAGTWVISDRFTDASFAYQGGGRGIDSEKIATLARWVQDDLAPDATLLLDAPVPLALERARRRGAPDRIEQEQYDFFTRVRAAYLACAEREPQRYHIIDAALTPEAVEAQVMRVMNQVIAAHDR